MYRQGPSSPVDPSSRALSGRLNFTIRRHKILSHPQAGGSGLHMSAKDKKVQEETEHKAVDPSKEADWMNKQVIFISQKVFVKSFCKS